LLQFRMDYTTVQKELERVQRLVNSPEWVRFATQAAAAAEELNRTVGKITSSADFAAFSASAERECARWAEWQRRQQEHQLSFPLRGGQRLPKRTIVRPEVTTQIGFRRH